MAIRLAMGNSWLKQRLDVSLDKGAFQRADLDTTTFSLEQFREYAGRWCKVIFREAYHQMSADF